MKNQSSWKPSKFVYKKGTLRASRNPDEVGICSTLIADLIANLYQENLPHHATGRLLDLGCGKVPLYEAYKDHISENVCVDWANSLHKNPYLDLEYDITQPLPFKDEEFDTIILSDVLEHIPEPDDLWNEMARILTAEGKIIMNVPFYYWLHEKPHDYYRYTEFALRRFAEKYGMKVIVLRAVGGVPEIIADVLAKTTFKIPLIGGFFARSVQWLTYIFLKTRIGKKISSKSSAVFPLGYFLVVQKN